MRLQNIQLDRTAHNQTCVGLTQRMHLCDHILYTPVEQRQVAYVKLMLQLGYFSVIFMHYEMILCKFVGGCLFGIFVKEWPFSIKPFSKSVTFTFSLFYKQITPYPEIENPNYSKSVFSYCSVSVLCSFLHTVQVQAVIVFSTLWCEPLQTVLQNVKEEADTHMGITEKSKRKHFL